MNIFVTGGAGFIGRNLVESLLKRGDKVTIYDNFSNSSEDKTSALINKGANKIKGAIEDYDFLKESLSGFDTVIHLAAKISVPESIANPEITNQTNVTGSLNVLRACVAKNIRNIIATSSAAVYGDCKDLPISENSSTIPTSPYGASKLAMENYMQAFANSFDLNCISLRIFNVYGKGQTPEYAGVISKFMEQIAKEKSPVIFGDGLQTRDFVSIDDVVDAFLNAISHIQSKRGDCFNIASETSISIKDLAQLMISISGKNLEIEFEKPRKGDILHSLASISLARNELSYSPKVTLQEGLENLSKANKVI